LFVLVLACFLEFITDFARNKNKAQMAFCHIPKLHHWVIWHEIPCFAASCMMPSPGFDAVALPANLQKLTFGEHFNQSILGDLGISWSGLKHWSNQVHGDPLGSKFNVERHKGYWMLLALHLPVNIDCFFGSFYG